MARSKEREGRVDGHVCRKGNLPSRLIGWKGGALFTTNKGFNGRGLNCRETKWVIGKQRGPIH